MALETFDRGVNTTKDPLLLEMGELQRATNCFYRAPNSALLSCPGRTAYCSAEASVVKGLRYIEFEQPDPSLGVPRFLLAHVGSAYRISTFSAESGTFGDPTTLDSITNVGSGTSLELVAYGSRRFLLNGNSSGVANRALFMNTSGSPVIHRHGMAPVVQACSVAAAAGVGWPSGVEWGNGIYFVFVTEVDKSTGYQLESSYDGPAPGITDAGASVFTITGTADGVTVTFPTQKANANATHWRLYIVGPKDTTDWTNLWFVDAVAVGDFDIALASTTLGNPTATPALKYPGVVVSQTGFTNPNNILLDDDVLTTATKGATIQVGTFGFNTGAMSTVRGLAVDLQIQLSFLGNGWPGGNQFITVYLSFDNGVNWTARPVTITGQTPHSIFLRAGGEFDLWNHSSITPGTQLDNAHFKARVDVATGSSLPSGTVLSIDFVRVTVYNSASAPINKGDNYPTTILNIGPVTDVNGSNGPPPVASTGDIFEESLLTNDISDPTLVRWSLDGNPDAFPKDYFLRPGGGNSSDIIVHIKTLHNVALVLMRNKVARINSLPRAEDQEFSRGRAFDHIDKVNGCVGRQAVCIFTIPDQPDMLAYISYSGPRWTNGVSTETLVESMDFENTVNLDKLDKAILINYPNIFAMAFYYVPKGDTTSTYPTRCIWLCYHPTKVTERGKLTWVGPTNLGAASATLANLGSQQILLTGHNTDFKVYVEDRGNSAASGEDITPDVVLRDIYPAGLAGDSKIGPMYLRVGFDDPGKLLTVLPYARMNGDLMRPLTEDPTFRIETLRTNIGGPVPGGSPYLQNAGQTLRVAPDFSANGFTVRITAVDVPGEPKGRMALQALEYGADQIQQNS